MRLAELTACPDEAAPARPGTRGFIFGKQGEVMTALKEVGTVHEGGALAYGQKANQVKEVLTQAYDKALAEGKERALAQSLASERVDVTLPGRVPSRGRLHISNKTLREIYAIFAELGFQIYRSREVEDDETNFGLLNHAASSSGPRYVGHVPLPPSLAFCCARSPHRGKFT